jgi:hypothetical protein
VDVARIKHQGEWMTAPLKNLILMEGREEKEKRLKREQEDLEEAMEEEERIAETKNRLVDACYRYHIGESQLEDLIPAISELMFEMENGITKTEGDK